MTIGNAFCIPGAILAVLSAEKLGRRKTIIISSLGFIVSVPFTILGYYLTSLTYLTVGMLFVGVSCGFAAFIVPIFSNFNLAREIIPTEIYGAMGAVYASFYPLGGLASFVFSAAFHEGLLVLISVLVIPLIIVILQIMLLIFKFTEESPTFLL